MRLDSSERRRRIVCHSSFSITIRRVERSSSQESPELEDLALRDDLTGAWNRRYLRRLLDEDWAALVATQGTITLLVLDLDFFKEINDSHGHLAGDHVLQRATNQLRASFRAEDRLIRYGGDEFVVALFGVGAEEARSLAERARTALRTVDIVTAEGGETVTLPLSFSMGVASFPADGGSTRRNAPDGSRRRPPTAVGAGFSSPPAWHSPCSSSPPGSRCAGCARRRRCRRAQRPRRTYSRRRKAPRRR